MNAAQRIPESDAHHFTDEAVRQLLARCHRVFFTLGWAHPFFFPVISFLVFKVGPCGTACVRIDGQIMIDPRFAATLSDDELAGVIAHEVSHLLYLYFERIGNRDKDRFNRASDRALNAILKDSGITLPECALLPMERDQWTWCAEDLYAAEPVQPEDGQPDQGRPRVGQGCGVDPAPGRSADDDSDGNSDGAGDSDDDSDGQDGSDCPNGPKGPSGGQDGQDGQDGDQDGKDGQGGSGDGDGDDGEGGKTGKNKKREVGTADTGVIPDWGYIAAQCAASAQSSSGESGRILRRLTVSPPTRVRWETILRRAVNQAILSHGRDDNTWTRRSRRSQIGGPLYPGHTAYKTQVAVAIDTSGSMGDKAIADAISNTVKIAKVSGCRIFLVGHTSRAYFARWINPREATVPELEQFLNVTGGTSFVDAFAKIEESGGRFDVLVQATDGECYWPDPPKPKNCKRQVIALLGMRERSYAPKSAEVIDATIE